MKFQEQQYRQVTYNFCIHHIHIKQLHVQFQLLPYLNIYWQHHTWSQTKRETRTIHAQQESNQLLKARMGDIREQYKRTITKIGSCIQVPLIAVRVHSKHVIRAKHQLKSFQVTQTIMKSFIIKTTYPLLVLSKESILMSHLKAQLNINIAQSHTLKLV